MVVGRLHVIVNVPDRHHVEAALRLTRVVVDAGAPVVQLRAKNLVDAMWLRLACDVQAACAAAGALCIVNDRADIAVAAGAAGAHVGDEDLPVAAARRVLGPGAVLGATARTAAAALAAAAAGASYVGVGPCYATSTKTVDADLLGAVGLREVTAAAATVDLPVIAIAGVTVDRVPELLAAGAYGVAVVGAVASAMDPARAVHDLLVALEAGR